MKRNLGMKMAVVVAFVAMSLACSPTQKVIKTGDADLIYTRALEFYANEEWSRANTLFASVTSYYTGTNREDSILFFTARCNFKRGDFETATTELDDFRRRFGRSPFLEDAEGMYTLSHYYMAPASTRDQSVTKVALLSIDEFLSRYPESEQYDSFVEMREDLEGRLHEKTFLNAYTYYKIGRYKSAIVAFKNAMKKYPDSQYREKVSYYTVASAFELADNSVPHKKEDRFLQMIDSYYSFIAEFPESEYRSAVDAMERKARKYLDARGGGEGEEESDDNVISRQSPPKDRRNQ